jgi:DNA-binding CsgD family transcriptional regulator
LGLASDVDADVAPWTDAITLCEPVWIASVDECATRYPAVDIDAGIASLVALPLVANGAAAGVLVIGFARTNRLDARQQSFLVMLADLCSLVLSWSEASDARDLALRPQFELTLVDDNRGEDGGGNGDTPALNMHPRLTAREQQIALALTEGRRSSAVARDLGISIYTVRKHISAILRKYGVTSQSELIARIYRESARSG